MATIAYLRVSTSEQAESGAGLAAQLYACRAYAERTGETLAGTFQDEGISGACGLEKRPALLDAIASLDAGDVLLVAKRDRLGRDPIKVAMIESAASRKGARIVSAAGEGTESDDPASVLMRRMIDAFAEYERLIIGARTKAAMKAKKSKAERVGAVPYGYKLQADGVHLEPEPIEQAVIDQAKLYRSAGLGYRAIANRLNAKGFRSRTGRDFVDMQIKRMLAA